MKGCLNDLTNRLVISSVLCLLLHGLLCLLLIPPLVKGRDLLFLVIVTAVIFFTLELVYLYLMVVKAQKIVRKIHDKPEQCNAATRGWNIFVSKKTCFMIAKLLLILSMVIELAIYYFL